MKTPMRHPKEITVFPNDVTLRDGLQGSPHALTALQRVRLAKELVKTGYQGIEAGNPAANSFEAKTVRRIADQVGPLPLPTPSPASEYSRISALARLNDGDISQAYEAVKTAPYHGIHVYISTSERQFQKKFAGESMRKRGLEPENYAAFIREWVIEDIHKLLGDFRREHPECHLRFSPEDATRTDPKILEQVMLAAAHYSDVLNYPDTVGVMKPLVVLHRIAQFRRALNRAGFRDTVIAWHGHNDTGSAVPNAEMAIYGGAREVDTTVGSIGERAGMPGEGLWAALDIDNEEFRRATIAMIEDSALRSTMNIRPSHPLVREQIPVLHRLLEQMTGIRSGMFIPLVGDNIRKQRAGVHQAAAAKGIVQGDGAIYQAVDLRRYGIEQEMVMTPNSGWGGLEHIFQKANLPYRSDDRAVFFRILKRAATRCHGDMTFDRVLEQVYYPAIIKITGGRKVISLEENHDFEEKKVVSMWTNERRKDPWGNQTKSREFYSAAAGRGQGYLRAGILCLQRIIRSIEIEKFEEQSMSDRASRSRARAWVTVRNNGLAVRMPGEAKDAGAVQLTALKNAFNALWARQEYEKMLARPNV